MVASGRWSFTKSGRTWRHDCTLLNEAKHPPPLENRLFPGVWHFLAAKYYCFYRVQDRRSQIWFLVPHSARWMGIRLDFVCTLFVACATFTGVFTTTDAGTVFACYFNQKQQRATTLCYFLFKKMEKKTVILDTRPSIDSRAGGWSEGFPLFTWVEYFIIGKKRYLKSKMNLTNSLMDTMKSWYSRKHSCLYGPSKISDSSFCSCS